jgi:hypothetical protein
MGAEGDAGEAKVGVGDGEGGARAEGGAVGERCHFLNPFKCSFTVVLNPFCYLIIFFVVCGNNDMWSIPLTVLRFLWQMPRRDRA